MKIDDRTADPTVLFGSLVPGDVFKFEDGTYMVTTTTYSGMGTPRNCIQLRGPLKATAACYFDATVRVTPVTATLVLEPRK